MSKPRTVTRFVEETVTIGQIAFERHTEESGKDWGHWPKWDEIEPYMQARWEAVAAAVAEAIKNERDDEPAPQPEPSKAAPSPLSDLLNAKPAPRPTEPWQSPRPSIQPWYPVVPTRTAPPWTGMDDLWMRPFETWCNADGLSAGLGFPSGTKLTNDADGNLVATPPGEAPRIVLKAASVPSFSLTDPIAHKATVSVGKSAGNNVTITQGSSSVAITDTGVTVASPTVEVNGSAPRPVAVAGETHTIPPNS